MNKRLKSRKQIKDNSVLCLVAQLYPDSLQPHELLPIRLLCPWRFSRQEYWSGLPCPPPGDLPNAGIEPGFHTLQADSLPDEPPGKPMNTGVGSLSLLQEIFLTQEWNQGLPHCRQTLPAEPPGKPRDNIMGLTVLSRVAAWLGGREPACQCSGCGFSPWVR